MDDNTRIVLVDLLKTLRVLIKTLKIPMGLGVQAAVAVPNYEIITSILDYVLKLIGIG